MADGFVYFIRCEANGLIKIGWSGGHPDCRLTRIRCMSPVPLTPLGFTLGDREEERRLHAQFRDQHSHGEWFRPTPELEEIIAVQCHPWADPGVRFHRHPTPAPRTRPTVAEWAEVTALTSGGVTRTVAEWSRLTGVSALAIKVKLGRGFDPNSSWFFMNPQRHMWESVSGKRKGGKASKRKRVRRAS